jgi:ribosome maturation factor RimP
METRLADVTRLIEVIEPEAAALGFDLVRVKLSGSGEERTLQVMAEDPATGQLVVSQCMALSRRVSVVMDEAEEAGEELVAGAYNLEVSSPGIDRPLTRAKDFATWAGHEANFTLVEPVDDHRKLRGELLGIADGVVSVEDRKAGLMTVQLANIHSAKLVLTDKLIAATKPVDMTGADEVEESDDFQDTQDEEKAED